MDLLDLLPHRPPMRLLDEIVELVPGRRARARTPRAAPRRLLLRRSLSRRADRAGCDSRRDDRAGRRAGGRRTVQSGCELGATVAAARRRTRAVQVSARGRSPARRSTCRCASPVSSADSTRSRAKSPSRRAARGGRQRDARVCRRPTGSRMPDPHVRHPPGGPTMTGQMRRFVHDLRTEGERGPGRDATAVGVGVFIGTSAVLRLPSRDLPGGRHAAAPESRQAVSGREHLQPFHGAVPDLVRASGRRARQAGRAAAADDRSRQADGPVERGRRPPDRCGHRRGGARPGHRQCDLDADTRSRRGSLLRLARATGLGSVRRGQHHGVGVRARQAPRGSAVSDGPAGGSAAVRLVRGNARRCRMRVRPDACAAGRGSVVLARGSMAA